MISFIPIREAYFYTGSLRVTARCASRGLLGLGASLHPARSWTGSSPHRFHRPTVESVRLHAPRTRDRLVSGAELLLMVVGSARARRLCRSVKRRHRPPADPARRALRTVRLRGGSRVREHARESTAASVSQTRSSLFRSRMLEGRTRAQDRRQSSSQGHSLSSAS